MNLNTEPQKRTLQEQVFESLVAQIRSGDLAVGQMLLPERRLSEKLGVSRITVVRALERMAAEGWVTRQQGRGTFVCQPPETPGPTIAFMAAVPAHPSLFKALIGMSQVINAAGGQLRLLGSFEGLGSESDMVERALRDGAEGLIVYPNTGTRAPAVYRQMAAQGAPLVLIDSYFTDLPIDHVTYDDAAAAQAVCSAMFARGARRIAALPHREFDVTSVQARIMGARQAARAHGLPQSAVSVWRHVYADYSPSRPRQQGDTLSLKRLGEAMAGEPVDGLFALNGDVAGQLNADLSALGSGGVFAHPMIGACTHQPISGPGHNLVATALEQAEELGRTAAALLLGRINNSVAGAPQALQVAMQIA